MKKTKTQQTQGFGVNSSMQIAILKQALKGKTGIKIVLISLLYFLITGITINLNWIYKLVINLLNNL